MLQSNAIVALISPSKDGCLRGERRLRFAPMYVGKAFGRGGLTLLASIFALACSDSRTPASEEDEERTEVRDDAGHDAADSGEIDPTMSIPERDAGFGDTESAVIDKEEVTDAGSEDGGRGSGPSRPTFLPEERPLPTPELIEPDPIDVNFGDSVPAIAVRLARFIWRSEPDATTVALARNGELETASQVYEEALRLLADERAERGFLSFFGAWSEVTRTADNGLSAFSSDGGVDGGDAGAIDFRTAARAELDVYFMSLVGSGAGLRDLVQQSFQVTEPSLVELYAGEPTIVRTGVFSQPFLLAAGAHPDRPSPSRRGAFISRRLLCEDFAPAAHPRVGAPSAGEAVRGWLESETKAEACAECHALIDPLGFALDGFDQRGRGRALDAGEAIDTRADLGALGLPDVDGPDDLGVSLLYHRNTLPCVLSHWFKYALQRETRPEDDASWIELVRGSEFYELQEIPALIAATESFRAE